MRAIFPVLGPLILSGTSIPLCFAADVAGSSDYPGIGRFAGSEIKTYQIENYGETALATGPVKSAADAEKTSRKVEGKITRTVYRVPPGSAALEVFPRTTPAASTTTRTFPGAGPGRSWMP